MLSAAEAQELAEDVTEALGCLTDKGGAFTIDFLSEAEARLTRAKVLVRGVVDAAAEAAKDKPERNGYVLGILHAALAERDDLRSGLLTVSCQGGALVVHPYGVSGSSYRVKLEILPDPEPF